MIIIESKEVENILRYFDSFSNNRIRDIKETLLCSKKDVYGKYSNKRLYSANLLWDFLRSNYGNKIEALDVKNFEDLYSTLPLVKQERSFSIYPKPITIYD